MTDRTATVVAALAALGSATYQELLEHVPRRALRTAVARGDVVRVRRGRYALPAGGDSAVALELGGALSGLAAAVHHGWGVLRRPGAPEVTVPRTASRLEPAGTTLRWADLSDDERRAGVTGPVRTVLDCARLLPFPEALAVADSALRSGSVRRREVGSAAAEVGGPGASRARLVVAHASPLAANAFESGLRGWCLEAGYRSLRPQVEIRSPGRLAVVDLADTTAKVVLEADGFEVHGTRGAFARDLVRHNWLQSAGWVTRRFAWEHVMFSGPWVVEQVHGAFREAALRRPSTRPA